MYTQSDAAIISQPGNRRPILATIDTPIRASLQMKQF